MDKCIVEGGINVGYTKHFDSVANLRSQLNLDLLGFLLLSLTWSHFWTFSVDFKKHKSVLRHCKMRKGSATAPQVITIHVLREEKQKSTKSLGKCQMVISFLLMPFYPEIFFEVNSKSQNFVKLMWNFATLSFIVNKLYSL